MVKNIPQIFYDNGGYKSDSDYSESDVYISYDECTSTFVPQAVIMFNALCSIERTVEYTGSVTSSDSMDDLIIAELSLAFADSSYDTVHIDPETGIRENRHWQLAMMYMLGRYGIPAKGEFGKNVQILPGQSSGAYGSLAISTMSI